MKNVVEKIEALVTPPPRPLPVEGCWEAEETRLGIVLPSDYKEFIAKYGAGRMFDWLEIYSPFSKNPYMNLTRVMPTIFTTEWDIEAQPWNDPLPWGFYPSTGGLLCFAKTDNGDNFYWVTRGRPSSWTTVVFDRGLMRWHQLEKVGFSELLLQLLKNECSVFSLPPDCYQVPWQFKPVPGDAVPAKSKTVKSKPRKSKKS